MPESVTKDDPRWALWLLGLVVPTLPLVSMVLVRQSGNALWWLVSPVFVFGIIPFVDLLLGDDDQNLDPEVLDRLGGNPYHRRIVELYIPLQIASFLGGAWFYGQSTGWGERLGIAVSIGIAGGVAINAAHELGHKRGARAERFALVALAQSAYGHFYVEHNRGHHRNVATPEDPASSRFGESLWQFLPRTLWGSLVSAIRLERSRMHRRGTAFLSPHNHIVQGLVLTGVVWGLAVALGGFGVWSFLLIQAVIGIYLLESVNYLEHYGLQRQKLDSGRYEACAPRHSWNSDHRVSNVFLYQLQRHSDHHANPTRDYQALRSFEEAPTLPTGYSGMLVLAVFPWAWRRVMDPKVLAHYEHDTSLLNSR